MRYFTFAFWYEVFGIQRILRTYRDLNLEEPHFKSLVAHVAHGSHISEALEGCSCLPG